MKEIRHDIVEENDSWVYGKTYYENSYFGDWCKYKKGGNPPTPEQLAETELRRAEIATEYRKNNPWETSKEYIEVIKKWPLKEIK